MLTRFHKILIGLLAAQVVLAVFVHAHNDDGAVLETRPILAKFDAAKVTHVKVATTTGKPIEIDKRGDAWVLSSSFDYPVTASKVTDLLSSVAKLSAAAPIATSASRHKQLHVADDQLERKLTLTAGSTETSLIIGNSVGSRRTALRLAGDSRVFAVSGLTPWSIGATPREWVDPAYVHVPREEIGKLVIQHGTQTVEVARAKAGDPWTATIDGAPVTLAAGESLDTATIDTLVGNAASIDLMEPGDPKRTATPTATTTTITTITIERLATNASAAPVVIDVVDDGPSYWVHQRGLDRAVLVEKAHLDGLVTVSRDKLVKKEAPATTQTKAATSGAQSG